MTVTAPIRVPLPRAKPEIEYPERDGQPMGETEIHVNVMLDTLATLRDFFRAQADVYVAGNLLFYYVEGKPGLFVVPDVFVVKGVPKHERRIYKLWEEGQAPAVVCEITSRSTRREDTKDKLGLYAGLEVREYFLFDPLSEYLRPPMQGYALARGKYHPITPNADGALMSRELGLTLQREGKQLRLTVTSTGERLLTPAESYEKSRAEAEAHQTTEAEVERLRAELARLRGE